MPSQRCQFPSLLLFPSITSSSSSSSFRPSPSILILEASNDLGGRVRTDVTDDGYVLDRGFAVFVEDYPASRRLLDYNALDLRRFEPGARVRMRRGDGEYCFATLSDPLRRPRNALSTLFSPICGPLDKMRLIPLFVTYLPRASRNCLSWTR